MKTVLIVLFGVALAVFLVIFITRQKNASNTDDLPPEVIPPTDPYACTSKDGKAGRLYSVTIPGSPTPVSACVPIGGNMSDYLTNCSDISGQKGILYPNGRCVSLAEIQKTRTGTIIR